MAVDPELGLLLGPGRSAAAKRELHVGVAHLSPGPWQPSEACPPAAVNAGVLVLAGAIARELVVHDPPSTELFGPGDLIRTWPADQPSLLLRAPTRWTVLCPSTVTAISGSCARKLHAYPEITTMLLDRVHARAERLAVTQAIAQITGIDIRVEALLQHLAERWGRVRPDGVLLPLTLSHRLIGTLVGARRPTVSAALRRARPRRASRPSRGAIRDLLDVRRVERG